MLILQGVTYRHPNRTLLFSDINLNINKHDKIALVGNNGVGKSSLLKLMSGDLKPSAGTVKASAPPYYVPQIYGQFDACSVAEALQVETPLRALNEILNGRVSPENLELLGDDWAIAERSIAALEYWGLAGLSLDQNLKALSGGQKTRVFLAGIMIHRPEIVLLDEPTNHLDGEGRAFLREFISSAKSTMLIVSHDRALLNLAEAVLELSSSGLASYGGNYDFYREQKTLENEVLLQDLKSTQKQLRKARETEKEVVLRQQKLDARGKKKQEKAGLPRIAMNTLRDSAEKSTSKLKGVHAERTGAIAGELSQMRMKVPDKDKMKVTFHDSALHKGKVLIEAIDLNLAYGERLLWPESLTFRISSAERVVIQGPNGSGKTSLLKAILGKLAPQAGTLTLAAFRAIYIDQDYSLIDNSLTVYQQVEKFNSGQLQEHELKIRLHRFLFDKDQWSEPCAVLSGGEKMRLMLCALTVWNQVPDLMVLDEPSNNLDIQSAEILAAALNEYRGTLLVVSHDQYFLNQIGIDRVLGPLRLVAHHDQI